MIEKMSISIKNKVSLKISTLVIVLFGVAVLSFAAISFRNSRSIINQPTSTLIVDATYFSDWARLAGGSWKFKDTILPMASQLKEGLIKIDLSKLPLSKKRVTKVNLVFNISSVPMTAADPFSTTSIYYSNNDNWSFINSDPSELRAWPRNPSAIYSLGDSKIGWQKIDITNQYLKDNNNILTILFTGQGDSRNKFIASPGYNLSALRPYLIIEYTDKALPADLSVYDSDIIFEPALPNLSTNSVTVSARVRNNGSENVKNIPVVFYRGNPQTGGTLQAKINLSIDGAGGSAIASTNINIPIAGSITQSNDIYVLIDPDNTIHEIKKDNNIAKRTLIVSDNFNKFIYNFEGDLDNWITDNDVPAGGKDQRPWNIKTLTPDPKNQDYLGPPFEGTQVLDLAMDGTGDDGTIWIGQEFLADPIKKYKVSIEIMALAPTDGDMWAMATVAYIGRVIPEEETSFVGGMGGGRITSWQKQRYEGVVSPTMNLETIYPSSIDKLIEGNKIWVALGIGAHQEYQIHAYFDSLMVSFEELDNTLPDPPTNPVAIKNPITNNIIFGWNEYDSSITNFKIFYKQTNDRIYQSLLVGYPLVIGTNATFSYDATDRKIFDPQKSYDFYVVGYTTKGLASPASTVIKYQPVEAYFKFEVPPNQETFIFKLTDLEKIKHARDLINKTTNTSPHVMGKIIKQAADYNRPWSYQLVPETVNFFDNAMEICDANINYIEKNFDVFCATFPANCQWCPWNSRLISEVKF